MSEKEQLKLNIDRYVHAYRLGKEMNELDVVYRKADYFFSVIGVTLNTVAFLNTI